MIFVLQPTKMNLKMVVLVGTSNVVPMENRLGLLNELHYDRMQKEGIDKAIVSADFKAIYSTI